MIFDQDIQGRQDEKNLLSKLANYPLKSIYDLNFLLSGLNHLIHSNTSAVFMNEGGKLIYVAAYGKNDSQLVFQTLLEDESVEGHIFKNSKDVIVAKSIDLEYFKPDSTSSNILMPITMIGTPLLLANRPIGGLIAFNRDKNTLFTEADLQVMKQLTLNISDFLSKLKLSAVDKKMYAVNKHLVENLPFPFLMTNTLGKIEECSNKAREILNLDDAVGKNIFDILKVTDKNANEVNVKALFEEIVTKSGERTIKNVKVNGKYENIYNFQIKYLNPERMIHNVLFYFINTEDINTEKQKLVTNIAHELRTPMTAIMGSVQILLSDFSSSELSPTQKEFLTILKSETDRFASILTNILDYKESSDLLGLKAEDIRLNAIMIDIGNTFTMKILKKDIFFKVTNFENEIHIKGDVNAVKHIFYQIIDNAIKFSPQSGTVEVIYEGTKLEESRWRHIISIEDEGQGIPTEMLPHMFESFKREDEAVHSKTGTGLGLSIVKEILDTMGGRIEVRNKETKGTKVTLYF
ncbi:MAG: GAF domain-containing sensor histidine kinase [bacterium]|nr:GAF domain-containing sensor histidine kinase [bacterium]